MSTQHSQYVLLFSVLAVNSDQFQELHALTLAAHSYALSIGYTMTCTYVSVGRTQPMAAGPRLYILKRPTPCCITDLYHGA